MNPAFTDDVRAVAWKELRELADQFQMRSRANAIVLTLIVAQFSVATPWFLGPAWLASLSLLLAFPFIGATVAIQPVIDAFAGERERHTLETLLASRLRDRAILAGKMLAAFLPAAAAALGMFALGIVSVNLAHWSGSVALPPPRVMRAVILLSLLLPGFTITAGVFVSLRAPTVRQAAQTFGYIFMAAFLVPVVVPMLLPSSWREPLLAWLGARPDATIAAALAALLVIDAAFLAAALARFRRGRLALD